MRLYVMGEDAWHDFDSWPPSGYAPQRFHLQPGNALSIEPPAESTLDRYRYAITNDDIAHRAHPATPFPNGEGPEALAGRAMPVLLTIARQDPHDEVAERWGTDLAVISETAVVPGTEEGHVLIELAATMPEMIAEQLAGWGARVEVIGPGVVREQMARIGAELTERYGSGQAATPRTSPSSRRSRSH